jgi:hypothetical protein
MSQLTSFLVANWTAILFYLSVGTALTKVLDKAATRWPALLPAATVVDELVFDLWDFVTAVAKLIGQPFAKPAEAAKKGGVAIVLLVLFVLFTFAGCGIPPKAAVQDACAFLDSGNPVIGTICLTVEEAASVVTHAKASRAARMKFGGAHDSVIDVCAAPVTP